ncbi:helix-turn-helix domain-containing protein [Sabulicella glaciei]|uniref:Helix-turn-helix domain-containing protein n=1 Tax=Sabulicella glaciei TaxID=2984948 RepID=A0ABT3NVX3_9PROT|nr:helix-turn-helix transcriptional regulator [Roseococcus sp. MDT2-1-1]MCW8086315.1 helix-turn-helix domain-containing protein [Roseococcus sp. MDT2-1-1]
MKFADIGQQLRAYRMESGMRAEEIAARLGVSRAALYRYEKGEVIKLETIRRLAELLKVSPLALLGIGIEYFARPAAFQERLRGLEEQADQVLQIGFPYCDLLTSDGFDGALAEAWRQAAPPGAEGTAMLAQADQALGALIARKRLHAARRPTVIAVLGEAAIGSFLSQGLCYGLDLPPATRERCKEAARQEVLALASLMDSMPLGLQIGLTRGPQPAAPFVVLRGRERAHVVTSPLSAELPAGAQVGVAGITAADEAVAAHQRIAETIWREALKGPEAAERLRELARRAVLLAD